MAIDQSSTVLIVIDLQNDFCPGGALAVAGGADIVPLVNQLIGRFDHVVLTQDWHPAGHSSFASSHPGSAPFSSIAMDYGPQTLWPDHCIQGSPGAEFHRDLSWTKAELVIRKGFRAAIDSYSAFFENDRRTPTGLSGYLHERRLTNVVLCGLATDFCVGFSAQDAARLGIWTIVLEDASRAIDLGGSLAQSKAAMAASGVRVGSVDEMLG